MQSFKLDVFIKEFVTGRSESLFLTDLKNNEIRLREQIDHKSVLVIGGAGTIGSAFIKALLKFNPSRLYVVDINENGLTELTRDLRSSTGINMPGDFKTYPVNFGEPVFEKIFIQSGPFEIVANFAAHKHVRSEKDHYSIQAMIENNVLNATKLLDLLLTLPPVHFFCVSTDKAANPVNVMGASKKLMEEVMLAYSRVIPVTTARFANVAFSNGSLPFGFLERLAKQQPLSAPMDVRRYFVSPEESGQLCLLACMLGHSGDIFFPKIEVGELKDFSKIAEDLLSALGYEPDYCLSEEEAKQKATKRHSDSTKYPVYFFESDTSGEKPFEEFVTKDEAPDMDRFAALGVIKNASPKTLEKFLPVFEKLASAFEQPDLNKSVIVSILEGILPDFSHKETHKSLDDKM